MHITFKELFEAEPMRYHAEYTDLVDLYLNHRDSEMYKETVLFLDSYNPDWRKNSELGYYAAELILWLIGMYEDTYHDDEKPYPQRLALLYEEIANEYERIKSFNQEAVMNELEKSFDTRFEEVLNASNLVETDPDYDKKYEKLYEQEHTAFYQSKEVREFNDYIWVYF